MQAADTLVERTVVKVLLGAPEAATRLVLEAEQASAPDAGRPGWYPPLHPDAALWIVRVADHIRLGKRSSACAGPASSLSAMKNLCV